MKLSIKKKAVLNYQLFQLTIQKADLNEKISHFEKTLMLISPDFDLRKIRTQFIASKVMKSRLFQQNLQWLISQVLRQDNEWKNLYQITSNVVALDNGNNHHVSATREHELAVIRVLRTLYKRGIIERKEVEINKRSMLRVFLNAPNGD